MGIILAILASLFLGTSNIFLKKSYKSLSPVASFFIFSLIAFCLWMPLAFFLGINWHFIFLGIAVGLASAVLGQGS